MNGLADGFMDVGICEWVGGQMDRWMNGLGVDGWRIGNFFTDLKNYPSPYVAFQPLASVP